jgi:putative Mg2+ transporter-C (MgtC) family protein
LAAPEGGQQDHVAELSVLAMVGRLLLAALLGAVIGAEREASGQDAGLRTHLMLALGASLFGLISVGAWDDFFATTNASNYRVDVTRVASYVAAGIGFIGGGAILKQGGGVRGLTTASSLWVAAAAGLACGVGFWIPAVVATAAALLSLVALRPVRTVVARIGQGRTGNLVVHLRDERAFADLVRTLSEGAPTPVQVRGGPAPSGGGFEVVAEYAPADPFMLGRIAERLAGRDEVTRVHVGR